MEILILVSLIVVSLLVGNLILELLKKIEFKDLIFLSIELSIIATTFIIIGVSQNHSNVFFSLVLIGLILHLIGIHIFISAYIKKYRKNH